MLKVSNRQKCLRQIHSKKIFSNERLTKWKKEENDLQVFSIHMLIYSC